MAKRKNTRRGGNLQQTIFKWLRIGALIAPAALHAVEPITPRKKIFHIMYDYTGFDIDQGNWDLKRMATGWMPFIATSLATYGIPKLIGFIKRFK